MTKALTSSLLAMLSAIGAARDVPCIVVRLLPDTITLAVIPAAAAVGGALFAVAGLARHAGGERIRRLVLAGNLAGAATGLVAFLAAVAVHGLA
jgi:hypothetical protein